MHNQLETEVFEAQSELNTLSAIAESFFPPIASLETPRQRRSIDEEEPHNRTRRPIGAVAALAAGTGFILGEPIKDAACNALSIFNLCDSDEKLERELDQVTKQPKTQQQAFQTVQEQNNEKLALLRDEIRLTQKSVKLIKEDTHAHISYMLERIYTLEDVINSKMPTATFISLHNFIYHKLAHCTLTSKHFVQHFIRIEAISFQFSHLLPRDISHHNSSFQHSSAQSCKNSLLKNPEKVANRSPLYNRDSKPSIKICKSY